MQVADTVIAILSRCEMKKLTLAVCLLLSAACPALPSALAGSLHDAAEAGDIEQVNQHITGGTNVNETGFLGLTPLPWQLARVTLRWLNG